MFWLRSSACQVLPPSLERYRPFFGTAASMNAYTTSGLDGATATAIRPHGLVGKPAAPAGISDQVAPPSVVLNNPEPLGAVGPSPPERKVQPRRRKSHIPAKIVWGCAGSIEIIEQPVERFDPASTLAHVFPPSLVL